MPLDSAQVTSRANSQLFVAQTTIGALDIPPAARMELLAAQVAAWHRATEGSVGKIEARQQAEWVASRNGESYLLPR